jgi:hypothetical protein
MSILSSFSRVISYSIGRMLKETGLGMINFNKLALDAYGSTLTRDIAHLEPLSRHRTIMPVWGTSPVIYDSVLIADNASLIGEVVIGDSSTLGLVLSKIYGL